MMRKNKEQYLTNLNLNSKLIAGTVKEARGVFEAHDRPHRKENHRGGFLPSVPELQFHTHVFHER